MRSRSIGGRVLLVVLAVGFAEPALADLWYEHYDNAEKAIQVQNWTEAIEELNQAIEKKADPGVRVQTYGMKFINYHPYLKLGIAYYELGQLEAAFRAFDTEEALGAIADSPDRASLQSFRQRALDAQQERIAVVVKGALAKAKALEDQGRLDAAMAEVSNALAVSQEDPDANAAMQRLRGLVAEQEKQRQLDARIATLVERGRGLLGSGEFEQASSVFNQALSLKPSAEVQAQLEQSQNRLREQIQERQDVEAGRTVVADGLRAAGRLESLQQVDQALAKLQSVLAVEPGNRQALDMQDRLLAAREEALYATALETLAAELLSEAEAQLNGGLYDESMATLNQVLAFDQGNSKARSALAQAYAAKRRDLLAPGPKVRITDLRNEPPAGPDGTLPEDAVRFQRVADPDFLLTGNIFAGSPVVDVVYYRSGEVISSQTIRGSIVLPDIYGNSFTLRVRLPAGRSTLTVEATNAAGLRSSEEYVVVYDRPLHRSPWLYSALGLVLVAAFGTMWRVQAQRRNRMLKRRFNPYVAGAPVLEDDLFFGRENLMRRVLQTIHNNSVLLYGERRIGKTSFQHHLKRRLKSIRDSDYDFYPVFIDLQGTPQERFFGTLAEDVFEELGPILNGHPVGPRSPEDGVYSYQSFVRDIRDVLKALKDRSSKRVKLVLLIDEVDELNAYDPKVNQKLRSLFMKSFAEDLVAVVSGVGIKKHWASEGSPWYNFFEEIEVKPFTREDAETLIEDPVRGIFKLERGAVETIIEKTDCKPYLIQKMCVALVNRLHEQQRRVITVADVNAVGSSPEA